MSAPVQTGLETPCGAAPGDALLGKPERPPSPAPSRRRESRPQDGAASLVVAPSHPDARLPELDALRGIAAPLVLLHHALAGPLPLLMRQQSLAAALGALAGFSLGSDLAAYAGSALLILLAVQPGRLRSELRRRIPVALGRVSFSQYLVHVPVLLATWHLAYGLLPARAAPLLGVALALSAAPLPYRAAEEPARRLAQHLGVQVAAWASRAGAPRHADGASRGRGG